MYKSCFQFHNDYLWWWLDDSCLQSHKRVSLKLHDKFSSWIEGWREENLSEDQRSDCEAWLMGHGDDVVACNTTREPRGDEDSTPYFSYNKYHVEYEYETKSEAGEPAETPKEAATS